MKESSPILEAIIAVLITGLISNPGFAHTTNESTLFPDIKDSDSRFDVILLVGVGIIPETETFKPDIKLSKLHLAAWGALANGLIMPEQGEVPDINALALTSLKNGLIDHLNGNADYADINWVLFGGGLQLDFPDSMPSREKAVKFIVANLESKVQGETILSRREMEIGPTGKVNEVESTINPDGSSTFYLTVGDQSYAVYSHGKLANGPLDLNQWKGKVLRRSVVRNLEQFKLWIFLEAED